MFAFVMILIAWVLLVYAFVTKLDGGDMPGRQFFCTECHEWHPVDLERGVRGSRRVHAEEHTAAAELFSSDELLELDAMLNGFYGGTL